MIEPIKLDFVNATPGPKGRFPKNLWFRMAGLHGGPELYGSPGHTALVTPKYAEVRGLFSHEEQSYAVIGNSFYKINSSMTATLIDTLESTSGPVSMDTSDTHLMITDSNTDGYLYSYAAGTLSKITSSEWPGALNCTQVKGFFAFTKPNSDEIYVSEYHAPATITGTDFLWIEVVGDELVGCMRLGEGLWAFGKKSIEPLVYTGNADFPFSLQRATLDVGCAATHSITRGDGSLFWLNNHKEICRSQGFDYVVISPEELTQQICGYSTVDDALFYFMNMDGHGQLVAHFPTEGKTWVHDVSLPVAQSWSQWSSGLFDGRHRSNCYTSFEYANKHLIGDFENGKISELSLNTYSDDGANILRERIPPAIKANGKKVKHHSLKIEGRKGVGDLSTTNPRCTLDWSDDLNGNIWSNEIKRSLGAIGEYQWEAVFGPSLGTSRHRTYRWKCSEKVPVSITSGDLKAHQLRN